MKDYAAIVFAGHLGLTERADIVANAFNASAANAKDYLDFKQEQDDKASVAMTKAITQGQSRLSQNLSEMQDRIAERGGVLSPAELSAEETKLGALKTMNRLEKFDIETLKPQLDSFSQLFNILGLAEAKMNGFDSETLRHTKDAKGHLMQFHGQMAASEIDNGVQSRTIEKLETQLRAISIDNAEKAKKDAFGSYLKSGPAVAAPMPAPATAKFRKKSP